MSVKRNFQIIGGTMLALALTVVAWGYTLITDSSGIYAVTWPAGSIPMQIKLATSPALSDGTSQSDSVQAAMQAWNTWLGTVQFAPQALGPGTYGVGNGANEIVMDSTVDGTAFGSNVLAVTMSYRTGNTRTESDIIFNTAYTWDSYRGNLQTPEDVRRVAIHELGHVLGLGHPDLAAPPQSVTAIMNSTVSNIDTMQADDITGTQSLYGLPGFVPANNDFANATTIILSNNAAQATGTNVAATKEAGEPTHAGNTGGRSVWWKWTAPSNTAVTITTLGSKFDTVMGGYTGASVSTLTEVASNDDVQSGVIRTSAVTFNASSGTTYYIAVDGWDGYSGPITLNVSITGATGIAPSVATQPAPQIVTAGNNASFSIYSSGTAPLTFHWQVSLAGPGGPWTDLSDDSVYSGSATGYLYITAAPLAYNGNSYRCIISNAFGSTTSDAVSLTVNAAVLPSISGLPSSLTLNYGDYLSFNATVTGSYPFSYQWFKDGVAIPGATSTYYSKSGVTTADSGSYTFKVSNAAGTVTSQAVSVVVNSAIAPSITQQPVAATVTKGYAASFNVIATGSPTLRYQWYLNGQAITNATSSYYSISAAIAANAGSYTVSVANDAGSVTSAAAQLVVLPAAKPVISGGYSISTISSNVSYINFYPSVTGTAPITYQWFKDGVAISGATSSSFSKSNATAADAGVYTLQATNEAGTTLSNDMVVQWVSSSSPWLDAVRVGDVLYFLATAPGRIMRYDLAQEAWLPITYLSETKVPTAFLPTPDGVFVAYNQELVRRSLDLVTETPVTTSTAPITALWGFESLIYYADNSAVRSWHRDTLAAGPDSPGGYYGLAYLRRAARPVASITQRKIYTTRPWISPNDIEYYTIAADGTISGEADSPYHGDLRVGNREYLTPGEQYLVDNSGVIYNLADLTYAGSYGRAFDDLDYLDSGTAVVLRGSKLTTQAASNFIETGRYSLPNPAYSLFCRGTAAFAFGAPADNTSNPTVTKVVASAFAPDSSTTPPNPVGSTFSVDYSFVDNAGVLYLLSRTARSLIRWDTQARQFLDSLPLRGNPSMFSYAPTANRLVLAYSDGTLTQFRLGVDTTERIFANYSAYNTAMDLVAIDDQTLLHVHEADVSADLRLVLGSSGNLQYMSTWSYHGTALAWQSANRRLFSTSSIYSNTVGYFTVPGTGFLPGSYSFEGSANNVTPPLRLSTDGTLILSGNGSVLNASLQQVGTLANSVTDGAWLTGAFLTIRASAGGTDLQRWARIIYNLQDTRTLTGTPVGIYPLSDSNAAVVTTVDGRLVFYVVDANLKVLSADMNGMPAMPVITVQPVSQNVTAGNSSVLTVTATGVGSLTYQWRFNGVNIPGATGNSLSLANVQTANQGAYDVLVSNANGSATSATVTVLVRAGRNDLNGDGQSDLLWQNSATGQIGTWLMNGTNPVGGFVNLVALGPDGVVAGVADFDADGKTDLLVRNRLSGAVGFWLLDGTTPKGAYMPIDTIPLDWQIAGVGDFNADGKVDIVWQNTVDGRRGVWLMNGTSHDGNYQALPTIPPEWTISAVADFNADGKPDLLWTDTQSGVRGFWLMDGLVEQGDFVFLTVVPPEWTIAQTGDFNGDGKTDLVWSNVANGVRGFWLMNGTTPQGDFLQLAIIPPEWKLGLIGQPPVQPPQITSQPEARHVALGRSFSLTVGASGATSLSYQWSKNGEVLAGASSATLTVTKATIQDAGQYTVMVTDQAGTSATSGAAIVTVIGSVDLNADGQSDLLWQNSASGQIGTWLMNGTSPVGDFVNLVGLGPDGFVAGVADFDGDGHNDLLVRNRRTGEVGFWLLDGTTPKGAYQPIDTVPLDWQIAGVGDFNADGKADIVWQNMVDGRRGVWLMNGTSHDGNYQALPTIPPEWTISAVADFNTDGKPDLLWTGTQSGVRGFWLMDGLVEQGDFVFLTVVPPEWTIAQTGDFNGDGKADIVWSNVTNGVRGFWLMNGTAPQGDFLQLAIIPPAWRLGI